MCLKSGFNFDGDRSTDPLKKAMINTSTSLNGAHRKNQDDTLLSGIVHGEMSKITAIDVI